MNAMRLLIINAAPHAHLIKYVTSLFSQISKIASNRSVDRETKTPNIAIKKAYSPN